MEDKHTPTPWKLGKHGVIVGGPVRQYVNGSAQDQIVMACVTDEDNGSQLGNAEFIVRACNAHDQLVAALRDVRQRIETSSAWWMDMPDRGGFDLESINAALAAAGAV